MIVDTLIILSGTGAVFCGAMAVATFAQGTAYDRFARSLINADHRKVGAIHFVKIGRLTISVTLSQSYRPIRRKV